MTVSMSYAAIDAQSSIAGEMNNRALDDRKHWQGPVRLTEDPFSDPGPCPRRVVHPGLVYAHKGEADRAVALMDKARTLSGPRPDVLALYGCALANAGRTGEAKLILDELRTLAKRGDAAGVSDGRRARGSA